MTTVRETISLDLTSEEAKYILHALKEFKKGCHQKIEEDEDGEGDMTHMYANDVMQARCMIEKIENVAIPAFGKDALVLSYGLL